MFGRAEKSAPMLALGDIYDATNILILFKRVLLTASCQKYFTSKTGKKQPGEKLIRLSTKESAVRVFLMCLIS